MHSRQQWFLNVICSSCMWKILEYTGRFLQNLTAALRPKRAALILKILPVLTDYLQEVRYAVQDHTERYYEGTC